MLNAPATGLALAELIVDGRAESVDLAPSTSPAAQSDDGDHQLGVGGPSTAGSTHAKVRLAELPSGAA